MGNSVMVAQKHYLQTTEAHYEKAVQNPVQQASELLRNAPHSAPTSLSEAPENADSQRLKGNKINPTRARRDGENEGKTSLFDKGDAESDVMQCLGASKWVEVRELIFACEELSAEVRQKLIALGDAKGMGST